MTSHSLAIPQRPIARTLHYVRLWLPVSLLYGNLALLSIIDRGYHAPPYAITLNDKLPHFLAFALIGTLVLRALQPQQNRFILWRKAILITASLGFIDEFLQHLNRSRTGDPLDFLADLLGATFAITIYLHLHWYQKLLEFPLLRLLILHQRS
ncbi:MAG: VanZ family protein [Verrucomicrobiota bacterium]